jgi:putative DNA primase/helicase
MTMTTTTTASQQIAIRNANIPQVLKDCRNWCRWFPGGHGKQPANLDGSAMFWKNPDNWLTFDQVSRFDKIGVILDPKATGIIPCDVDGCRNKDTGEVHPLVLKWMVGVTYGEATPSKMGNRFYIRGRLPDDLREIDNIDPPWKTFNPGQEHVGIEIYNYTHFLTITGNIVPGCPTEINEDQALLNDLLVRFGPPPKKTKTPGERQGAYSGAWDFDAWVRQYIDGAEFVGDGYIIPCPWMHEHSTPGDTAKIWAGPPHTFSCFHAHCKGRTWDDILEHFDPERFERKRQWQERPSRSGPSPEKEARPIDLCSFDADDSGNGDAVYAVYGESFLYCSAYGWLSYVDTHWKRMSDDSAIKQATVKVLRERRLAAVRSEKEAVVKCTLASSKNVNGAIDRFKSLVSVPIEVFDNEPDLFNALNGVVDLRTGSLMPHLPSQRFTWCAPVAYAPGEPELWLSQLQETVGGGQEMIDYLQLALGYSLTGHTNEECLFYLYGPSRSGKGTLAETISALLPSPLAESIDFTSLTAKRTEDTNNFDLARLKPSRMVFASESNRSQPLNTSKIKTITGGDNITASHKHRDAFTYKPQFKLWMLSNWPVNGDPEDDALWGRVRVIEFPHSFLGKEDKSKKARLRDAESLQAILYWCIQGAIKWYALGAQGLSIPAKVSDATKAHRDELDFIAQWLAECTAPGEWISNAEINASYQTWCEENHVSAKKARSFALSLQIKGYKTGVQKKVEGKNCKGIAGLQLRTAGSDEEDSNGLVTVTDVTDENKENGKYAYRENIAEPSVTSVTVTKSKVPDEWIAASIREAEEKERARIAAKSATAKVRAS